MTSKANSNFVVLTTNRSGSEWVMSTLNGFQGVSAHGELFLSKARSSERKWDSNFAYPRFVEVKSKLPRFRPFSVFSYLDSFYRTPNKAGFKLMYKQLGFYPEILLYFIQHQTQVIHLVRRNHLDVMLSYAVKAKTGKAHLLKGQATPDHLHVELDTKTLVRKLAWLQKQQEIARKLLIWCRLPHLEIAYEDLARNPIQFHLIGDFLSINSREQMPQSALTKIRKGGHRDVIGNYDQVKKVLNNSKFAGLLE
jgi:LPS sulfotransferase NodH